MIKLFNIWKIGAWPGFPGNYGSPKRKKEFVENHALPKNYVAIGWSKCRAENKTEEEIKEECDRCGGFTPRGRNEFIKFTRKIKEDDIILLYNYYRVYVGRVRKKSDGKIHYETKEEPRHRIDVEWLYKKKPKKADFGMWDDTVHQVLKKDLPKIKDIELRTFLKRGIGAPIIRKPLRGTAKVKKYGRRGEGSKHKMLKEWIANNSDFIGLDDVNKVRIEYGFLSGDRADIVFERTGNRYAVVEIETDNPLPGAYQALKYKTLYCAELGLPIDSSNIEAMLVAWSLPSKVKVFCNKYNIKHVKKKL